MRNRASWLGVLAAVGTATAPVWSQCTPTLEGKYESPRSPVRIVVDDGLAYVAMLREGLEILDIADPTNPIKVGEYDTGPYAVAVAKTGDLLVLTHEESLLFLDVSDPTAPTLLGTFVAAGPSYDVKVVGDLAYVAAYLSSVQIVDVSDPADPVLVGTIDTTESYGLAVADDIVYVADGNGGLRAIDASNPASPQMLGQLLFDDRAWWVELAGSRAYVSCGTAGLQVIDVSDPASPTAISTYPSQTVVSAVDARRRIALIEDDDTLQVLDIAGEPLLLGSIALDDSIAALALSEDIACVGIGPFDDAVHTVGIGGCVPCEADFDRNGIADTRDVVAFLNAWVRAEPWADANADGQINSIDVLAFLNDWNAGC